jgi:Spy/CpxP family protein refolding chaperone
MKKKILIFAIVLLCLINLTALATLSYNRWIKPQQKDVSAGQASAWEAMQIQIDLKPNQIQRMQGLRFSFEKNVESLRQEMENKRIHLIEELRNPSPDLDRIDKIVDELSGLQAEVQKKTIRNIINDKKLLTPGQQERYFSLFEQHMHGQGRGQGRRGRGRGPRWLRKN